MSLNLTEAQIHLTSLLHGGSLNKVRNPYYAFGRAANTFLSKIKPLETIRLAGLSQTVHDDLYNYALPSDFHSVIDLAPQAERNSNDQGTRVFSEPFDRRKKLDDKDFTIEARDGTKMMRINWRQRSSKLLNSNDSYNGNGTWIAVATASGIQTDTIYKYSGGGSVRFDLAASGDGISNIGMSAIDLTDEDEVADVIIPIYLPSVTNLTSITLQWGNDITTKYWTGVAQTTQADGTAFKVGWNIIAVPWSTATETGTVAPATIDSFKITLATTGAIADIRVDNILFGIGFPFDIKYYSKFLFKNTSGTYITQPTAEDDTIVLDNDSMQIYLLETLIAMAQQVEGSDSGFDIGFAKKELHGDPSALDVAGRAGLYQLYRAEHPSESKKQVTSYGSLPRFQK